MRELYFDVPMIISTHALTEGDDVFCVDKKAKKVFQLTPSRRATLRLLYRKVVSCISTHALTEGDQSSISLNLSHIIFQLTPSRRATDSSPQNAKTAKFQLTPSRRATTRSSESLAYSEGISTHALTEGDMTTPFLFHPLYTFHLTPSRRATTSSGKSEN